MINLYDKNCINFNNNGLVVLSDCKSCYIEEKLNDTYELILEYPLDARGKWQYLIEGNIIKANGQLFRIYHKQKTLSGIAVNARHIFYDLLDNFLEDVRPTDLNGAGALDWILTHTQYSHPFTSMSDIDHVDTAYYQAKNPVEAILGTDDQSFVNRWGGEIVRDNFTIKMLQARGTDRGVLISYGKNIQGIEETIDLDSVITRIYPVGKDGLTITEKYVDSQYINNYPHPKIKKIEFSDIDTEDALRIAAQNYFADTQCDIPLSNYKIDFLELTKTVEYKNYAVLESVYLGDTVIVRHSKLNIDLKCKVIRIKKNILTGRIEEVELGSFKPNLASTFTYLQQSVDQVSKQQVQDKSDLQKSIDDATNAINTALGGYVVKRNGELLIMDTEDVNTATKVWRWNQGGLGYSSTGYNGPYATAITADGKIVADFITTGTLNAALIKTALITNSDSVKIAVGQIGGNNLFKDSSFMFGIGLGGIIYKKNNCSGWFQAIAGRDHAYLVSASASGDNYVAMHFTNPGAGTYMCAFDLQAQDATADWLGIVGIQEQSGSYRWFGKANANQHSGGISTTWFRYSFKVVIPSDAWSDLAFIFRPNTLSSDYIAYDNLQLELGENATAWRPNPDDTVNAAVSLADDNITAAVNGIDYASKIQQNADSVKIAVGQIGGNNLLKDSSFMFGIGLGGIIYKKNNCSGWFQAIAGRDHAYLVSASASGDNYVAMHFTNPGAGTYMCAFDLQAQDATADWLGIVGIQEQSGSYRWFGKANANQHSGGISTTWFRYSFKVVIPSDAGSNLAFIFRPNTLSGNYIAYDNLQLELGENVTAWRPNANELKCTDVTINDNGLTINNGAIAIKNNAGTTVLQGDVNGNLAINGAFITHNATMDYNGLTINNGAIAIKNNAGTTVLQGDANGNLAINGTFTADAYVDSIHKQSYIKDGEFYLHRDGYNHVGEITLNGEGMAFYSPTGFYFHHVDHSNGPITSADIYCNSVIATGSKPALVDTKDHAQQFLFSEESPEVVFRDRGHGVIGSDGTCAIFFDTVFAETVTTTQSDYYVLLTGYKGCNAEIQEKRPNYFIVCGNVDKEFDWEVICSRKGYERLRFNDVMGVNIGCLSS